MRRHKGSTTAVPVPIQGTGCKKPAAVSRAGFRNSCDDADMPVICPTCQIICWAFCPAGSAGAVRTARSRNASKATMQSWSR